MCACTEPVRTGIGAVCVEYGRPKWPITMLNHTRTEDCFVFLFLAPYACMTRYEEAFFPWKTKEKKARFARAPHDYLIVGVFLWAAAKNRSTWSVWGQKQVHSTIKSKVHPASPAVGPKRIVPVYARSSPGSPEFVYSNWRSRFGFLANQKPSIVPCYAPHTNADVRGDPLHPPHPTPRHTINVGI